MKRSLIPVISCMFLSAVLYLTGCESAAWEQQERVQIDDYIESLGDTIYELKASGLYYIELTPGTGEAPVIGDTVSIWSKGCLLDNQVFTSNYTDTIPFKFILGSEMVLKGINEGIGYMKEGGISRLVLPSKLAFGNYGYGMAIPGYTPLYYEVKLVSVKPGPK